MIIYLEESKKAVLSRLLALQEENESKKRLHFKKNELEDIFSIELNTFYDIIDSLVACRLIDIPFENGKQIDIYIYKEMIEEQLDNNKHYVRRYKEWGDAEKVFKTPPTNSETCNADEDSSLNDNNNTETTDELSSEE